MATTGGVDPGSRGYTDHRHLLDATDEEAEMRTLFEYDTLGNLLYLGRAQPGTTEATPTWQIKRFTYTGTDLVAIEFANASPSYSSAWDARSSLTYG